MAKVLKGREDVEIATAAPHGKVRSKVNDFGSRKVERDGADTDSSCTAQLIYTYTHTKKTWQGMYKALEDSRRPLKHKKKQYQKIKKKIVEERRPTHPSIHPISIHT